MSPDSPKRDEAADTSNGGDDDAADPDGTSGRRSTVIQRRQATACDLQIQNPCGYREVAARRLRPWLREVLAELAPEAGSATVRIVSDREMRRLNREFRGIDKTTDVLSFPGDLQLRAGVPVAAAAGADCPTSGPRLDFHLAHLGDVVVSIPAARRQAAELGHDTARELRILALHGILHCLGYDHESDDGTMERVERDLRDRFIHRVAAALP